MIRALLDFEVTKPRSSCSRIIERVEHELIEEWRAKIAEHDARRSAPEPED